MDKDQNKKLIEMEDKALDKVAHVLVSIARELARKESAGDKEVDALLQELRDEKYN